MRKKLPAYLVGSGMALFVVFPHQQPGLQYGAIPFIHQLGLILMISGLIPWFTKSEKPLAYIGSKKVWIPLAIIIISITASGFSVDTIPCGWGAISFGLPASIPFAFLALLLGGIYLMSRQVGQDILTPFIPATIIASLSCIVSGITYQGVKTGGLVSLSNYDMATGLIVFGALVSIFRGQWWLTAIAIVGLFFTGADEAIFACGVLTLAILARRDWSLKLLAPVGALILVIAICTSLGITQSLYSPTAEKIVAAKEATTATSTETRDELLYKATGSRWMKHWTLSPLKPFGYGYNVNNFYPGIIHNVPMIIIEQIGILGALAWLWVFGFCLLKTKWKYAWIGLGSLCVFDHFIWTQAAPWFWALAGVSTASSLDRDYIFRR